MCGICGQLRFDGQPADLNLVSKMKDCLIHRGPDDDGIWQQNSSKGGEVALGHRRLAVIDLTPAGKQPMLDKTGQYCIVYNGEIYNYIEIRDGLKKEGTEFCTETDTEVILAAYIKYGRQCLYLFNGMYAFAIWDNKRKTLFCARDRLGIKPFYYTWKNGVFFFASEIKALLIIPEISQTPNKVTVYDYLSLGLMHHTRDTFFIDVQQLPAGCYLQVNIKGLSIEQYWQLSNEKLVTTNHVDFEGLKLIIDEAVRLRLRSDVPIGILLSGGLDSSSITYFVGINSDLSTNAFSINFEHNEFDESFYAKLVASHCNASLNFLKPQSKGLWEELDDLIRAQDAPTHAPEVYSNWCMMRAVAKCKIKVLLSGQGGDELFAGYTWYPKHLLVSLFLKGKFISLVKEFAKLPKNFPNCNTRNQFFLLGTMLHALLPSFLKAKIKPELVCMDDILLPNFRNDMSGRDLANMRLLDPSCLEKKLHNDISYCNIPYYLHYEDANSMAFGIEERVPFLDHRLVEWAQKLVSWWKIKGGVSKYPLRHIMKELLPEQIVNRKDKMGLSAPKDQWFRNELRSPINELFQGDCLIYENWIEKRSFLDHLNAYMQGKSSFISRLLWRCINIEKWLRINS